MKTEIDQYPLPADLLGLAARDPDQAFTLAIGSDQDRLEGGVVVIKGHAEYKAVESFLVERGWVSTTQDLRPPPPESEFWQSPALKLRWPSYPARFGGLVPMRIRMVKHTESDQAGYPGELVLVAPKAKVYVAWTNSQGAVAAILDSGQKLGVKPDEFEVVQWLQPRE